MSEFPLARHEAKYLLVEEAVPPLIEAIRARCVPDPNNGAHGYPVLSLYFDSPRYRLYWRSRDGSPYRVKYRLRRYANGGEFIEEKRRVQALIAKRRLKLDEAQRALLLNRRGAAQGGSAQRDPSQLDPSQLDPSQLYSSQLDSSQLDSSQHDSKGGEALKSYLSSLDQLAARPVALIRYQRVAFFSRDDHYARVTLDRRVQVAPAQDPAAAPPPEDPSWRAVDLPRRFDRRRSPVVLELKAEQLVPPWMRALTRRFGLERRGFSKYCYGLEALLPSSARSRPRWPSAPTARGRRAPDV